MGPQNLSGRRREEKNRAPSGTRTPTLRPSSRYTDCAIQAPHGLRIIIENIFSIFETDKQDPNRLV
jgi:hypothetical protein